MLFIFRCGDNLALTGSTYSHTGLCMRGQILSDQKCSLCGSTFQPHPRKRGLYCRNHPEIKATGRFRVYFGRDLKKRFESFEHAERFLDGLRYEVDKGTYDLRDYQSGNPLSFTVLSTQWLELKTKQVRPGSLKNLRNYISKSQSFFADRNIKSIQYADLEDFLYSLPLSDKSKSNARSCLHSFWTWLLKRRIIQRSQFPDFPEVSFELGWRKTIDKETQQAILDEVKRISFQINPKVWLGIKWLCTYISIRPVELLNLKEGAIDIKSGLFFIPHPKEKQPKLVPIIETDIQILSNFPRGLPALHFFRHAAGVSGCKAGQPFGNKYLYKWWVRACENLGIEGVDLYGGTRHSSALGLLDHATPEQIRRATMHSTNKAFERYFKVTKEEVVSVYNATQINNGKINIKKI